MSTGKAVEDLLRELAPQVLGAVLRRHGDFDTCEDAVQEALLAASVADRRCASQPEGVVDHGRVPAVDRDVARRIGPPTPRGNGHLAGIAGTRPIPPVDDALTLLLLCCHPALTPVSQVALTLRAVGGLNTPEVARALLVPEATVAQRISRAKQRIKATGAQFRMPLHAERSERIAAVLHVLYLIFNEGYMASSGSSLHRVELTSQAIRLTRQLRDQLPEDGEVAGLLPLMLLTDARLPARTRPDGALVPLAEQDRSRWDAQAIAEGIALITETLATAPIGPYQLQAAIAAVHDKAARFEDTDWPQILALYELLQRMAPGPMMTLNRIVAVAMVHGPRLVWSSLTRQKPTPRSPGTTASTPYVRSRSMLRAGCRSRSRAPGCASEPFRHLAWLDVRCPQSPDPVPAEHARPDLVGSEEPPLARSRSAERRLGARRQPARSTPAADMARGTVPS